MPGHRLSLNHPPSHRNRHSKQRHRSHRAQRQTLRRLSGDPVGPVSTSASDAGSKDRLFFALPNFLTLENSAHVPPMTTGQKFKVAIRSSFDYVQIPWYAALAGISQAENSEPGYGQGAEGYAKRFGSQFADG